MEAAGDWGRFDDCRSFRGCLGDAMKQLDGFTRLVPSAITISAMIVIFGLLAGSKRTFRLGTAYTVWTAIGAVVALILGVAAFEEGLTARRVGAAFLTMAGLVLMKFSIPI
jgi:quaternary ammonium compound-resistance protein SugE